MSWQWTPFTIFQSAAAIICIAAAIFNWRRFRHLPAARTGTALLAMVGWWMVGSVLEFLSVEPSYSDFWNKIQFFAIAALPPGWLTYILRYVGVDFKLTPRRFLILWLIPVLTLALIYTNGWHGLFWSQYDLAVVDNRIVKTAVFGPAFWVFLTHAYLLVFAGLVILLRAIVKSGRLYRWQIIGLIIIVLVPWLVNSARIFLNWKPFGGMDFTPIALGLIASVSGWAIYRLQMRDVGPVARYLIIEQMGDGVLVLNNASGIMDLNPAAQKLLQRPKSQLLGHPITQFWPDWPRDLLLDGQEAGRQLEWTLGNVPSQMFDLHATPLYDGRNRLISRIVVLRDIGEHKKIEAQLKSSLHEKEALLKEIHHRVKNNLQIISSLLNLQAAQNENEAVGQALQEGQSRVRSMALIHEILYRSENLGRIDFGEYIRQLAAQLHRTYSTHAERVTLDVQADELFLPMETAVPCGLILNELVSNAFKHGFEDGRTGQIQINLHAVENELAFSVADNGRGFPEALDFQQTPTLGLQLVNTLVSQINGQIALSLSHGTTFTIKFIAP